MPGQWNCQTGSLPDDPTRPSEKRLTNGIGRIQRRHMLPGAIRLIPSRSHRKSRSGCCPPDPQHGNDAAWQFVERLRAGENDHAVGPPLDIDAERIHVHLCEFGHRARPQPCASQARPSRRTTSPFSILLPEYITKFAYSSASRATRETMSLPRGIPAPVAATPEAWAFRTRQRDGNDPNAEPCKFACGRQRQSCDSAFGR